MRKILTIGDYWLWQGKDEKGYFYNVTLKGSFARDMESGYYNLETLLKVKGLNHE